MVNLKSKNDFNSQYEEYKRIISEYKESKDKEEYLFECEYVLNAIKLSNERHEAMIQIYKTFTTIALTLINVHIAITTLRGISSPEYIYNLYGVIGLNAILILLFALSVYIYKNKTIQLLFSYHT